MVDYSKWSVKRFADVVDQSTPTIFVTASPPNAPPQRDNLDSDSDDEKDTKPETSAPPAKKTATPSADTGGRGNAPSTSADDVLTVARARKHEADTVLNAVNNRADTPAATGFAEARRLYEGALSALDTCRARFGRSSPEGREVEALSLSCHMNIVATAIQDG